MKVVLFIFASLLVNASCQFGMDLGNPWTDTASCPPVDTEKVCSLKKKQCSPVNNIIKPPGQKGLVGLIRNCALISGVHLDLSFFFKVGISYAHNNPESIMDSLSSDPKVSSSIRACVLNASGLIDPDGKFNRTAAMNKLTQQPLGPNLIIPVFKGLLTCPEPVDYKIGPFLACLRKKCLASATVIFPPLGTGESGLAGVAGAPGPGMYGPGAGKMMPGAGGAGMFGSGAGKMMPGAGGSGFGSAPWASFIPPPGAFGGASGGPASGGPASGPESFGAPSSFGPGSFAGGAKAGPGAGGKWF